MAVKESTTETKESASEAKESLTETKGPADAKEPEAEVGKETMSQDGLSVTLPERRETTTA